MSLGFSLLFQRRAIDFLSVWYSQLNLQLLDMVLPKEHHSYNLPPFFCLWYSESPDKYLWYHLQELAKSVGYGVSSWQMMQL